MKNDKSLEIFNKFLDKKNTYHLYRNMLYKDGYVCVADKTLKIYLMYKIDLLKVDGVWDCEISKKIDTLNKQKNIAQIVKNGVIFDIETDDTSHKKDVIPKWVLNDEYDTSYEMINDYCGQDILIKLYSNKIYIDYKIIDKLLVRNIDIFFKEDSDILYFSENYHKFCGAIRYDKQRGEK